MTQRKFQNSNFCEDKKSSKSSSSFIWHRIKIFKKDAFISGTNWASIRELFIMLEWIKERFNLLQEKSEQPNKRNGKEQKKKKPFEDSSSDDEDDLTPNLTASQNKVKRKVMDSSSSDEEEVEVPSAKDKGEEEENLLAESFYYVNYGSSIITSKSSSYNLSNENKHRCFCCLQDKT